MDEISRREFFKKTGTDAAMAAVLAAGLARTLRANPLGLPIGSQTYPHRARIQQGEFTGLLRDMKAVGIDLVELCSPSYMEFASLADGKTTKKTLDDNGMKCTSAHFTLPALRTDLPKQIQWAQDVGMTQMGTASLNARMTNGMTTTEELKRAADEYNKIGAEVKKAGLQQFLHNETFENSKLEPREPDALVRELLALRPTLPRELDVRVDAQRVTMTRGTAALVLDLDAKTVDLRT